jgi:hypothetical protein
VIVVIVIATVIAFMIVIPLVVVLDAAVRAFPVAVVEPFSIVARADPASAFIWWPAPIASVPPIVSSGWIPVAAYPDESRSGLCGDNGDNARCGWRANADSDRYLSAGSV